MANPEHCAIIDSGVDAWNKWRLDHPQITPDLGGMLLVGRQLRRADFRDAVLSGADLSGSNLSEAEFCHAQLRNVRAHGTNFFRADFFAADLSGSELPAANLEYAVMVETNLANAVIDGSRIYGISVWRLRERPVEPCRLLIECKRGPKLTVDKLEVAQFLYLLLEDRPVTSFIEGISSKIVLILGRFTPARKAALQCIANGLREHDLAPVIFDFEAPAHRDLVETITLLARMSRFIVADLTEPGSIPQELQAIVPDLEIPIQPVILASEQPFATFASLMKYSWMLSLQRYTDCSDLEKSIRDIVIDPAEKKRQEILERRKAFSTRVLRA